MLNKVFWCEKFYLIAFEMIFITFILILHDFLDVFNKQILQNLVSFQMNILNG